MLWDETEPKFDPKDWLSIIVSMHRKLVYPDSTTIDLIEIETPTKVTLADLDYLLECIDLPRDLMPPIMTIEQPNCKKFYFRKPPSDKKED